MEGQARIKRTTKTILKSLLESDQPSSETVHEAIKSLPCDDPKELLELIGNVTNLNGTVNSDDEWLCNLSLFGLEVTKSLHQIVLSTLLNELNQINIHKKYWKSTLSTPWCLRYVQFVGTEYPKVQQDVKERINGLIDYEKDLVEWVGDLHTSLNKLSRIRRFDDGIKKFAVFVEGIGKLITNEDIKPIGDPNQLLNVLKQAIGRLPEFEDWFKTQLEPHSMPHHFRRNWLKYFIGLGSLIGAAVIVFPGNKFVKQHTSQTVGCLNTIVEEKIIEPCQEIWMSIFDTQEDLDVSKKLLQQNRLRVVKLLENYGTSPEMAEKLDLTDVMTSYDNNIKSPVINAGELTTEIYIQVQKMKLDTETIMLNVQQVLKANDINLRLMGLIPFVMTTCFGIKALLVWVTDQFGGRLLLSEAKIFRGVKSKLQKVEYLLIRHLGYENNSRNMHSTMSKRELGRLIFLLHQIRIEIPSLPESSRDLLAEDMKILESLNYNEWQKLFTIMSMYKNHKCFTS